MSHNRRGRPGGRPTKEWTEYVPKGKDPSGSHPDDYHEFRAVDNDQQRPTEDKADHQFNKRSYNSSDGHRGAKHRLKERQRYDERSSDSGEYAVKGSTGSRAQRGPPRQTDRNSDMRPYQKKSKRGDRDIYEEHEAESHKGGGTKQAFQWRECVICLLKCSPSSTVWNCNECRITCHLKCIRDWICKQNNIERYDARVVDRSKLYTWSCPHCQTPLKGTIPSYYCYCGKTKNPKQDVFLEPHSCELLCQRKKGALCIHPCTEPCHSGFCPPCTIVIPNEPCFCGKEVKDRQCGELNKKACNAPCNKVLNCKLHKCDKICHEGECPPCPIKAKSTCHCGKLTEDKKCGEQFSCGEVCNRQLDCEVHRCGQICHQGSCKNCELFPFEEEKCFCGKKLQSDILGHTREGCHEDRQQCGQACGKALVCGHQCVLSCHSGECQCDRVIEKVCRCASKNHKIPCHKYLDDVLCDKICKKKKSCKVHKCETRCCISFANSLDHMCMEFCGRMLECGKHPCPKKCHIGKCGECTIMMNQTLRCACGSRVKPAPIKCGTEIPICHNRCCKVLSCGHQCYYPCHYGDCKPCQEIVDKPCACGKKIIENGVCSVKMFCQSRCKNVLPCGHKCEENCHSESCLEISEKKKQILKSDGKDVSENGCTHSCSKKREPCGHPCEALCHIDQPECPLDPCNYLIKVKCDCGNRSKFVKCDCTDKKITKSLPCEDRCLNLQRFKALYEKAGNKVYYPGTLVKFANNNHLYLKKLEEKLNNLLLTDDESVTIHIDKNNPEKLKALLVLLPRHYMVDVVILKGTKSSILTISKTPDSILPQMPLSVYIEKIINKEIKVDDGPFDAVIRFHDLTFYENTNEVDKILAEVRGEYYAEIDRNNKVKLYIWNKDSLPKIKKLLQKSCTGFSQFESEEFKDKDEEDTDIDVVVREDNNKGVTQSGDLDTQPKVEEEKTEKQVEEMAEKEVPEEESDQEEAEERSAPRHVSAKAARELLFQSGNRKESEDQPEEPANDQ